MDSVQKPESLTEIVRLLSTTLQELQYYSVIQYNCFHVTVPHNWVTLAFCVTGTYSVTHIEHP
jgi:hypothetical protein